MPEILQTRGGLDKALGYDRALGQDGALGQTGALDTCVEAVHPWSAVAVQGGRIVWETGEPVATPWRSAAKPLQLATCLELLGDPSMQPEELAIGAASHSGQTVHVRWVREVLARLDVSERDLRCGTHPPSHLPSAEAVLREGGAYGPVHNNCSGKHAFMLAASARHGWDLDYRPAEHPLQQRILARVQEWTACSPALALDGCGVPTFCLPLHGLARAWSVIAEAMADPLDRTRLGPIGRAMREYPQLTSGIDRLDAAVMAQAAEPMAVKVGAGGVFCIALAQRKLGLAIKVHTGSMEALPAAVAETLRLAAPGAWQPPVDWKHLQVRNVAGALAGRFIVQ